MRPRQFLVSVALIVATTFAGLAIRMLPLDLSPLVVKYGGSMLWALDIYWLVSTILPRSSLIFSVMIAGIAASSIEFLKLYHTPAFETFRDSLLGTLLIGHIFSFSDIGAYWLAIAIGGMIDSQFRSTRTI
jgi:hypothetical protein